MDVQLMWDSTLILKSQNQKMHETMTNPSFGGSIKGRSAACCTGKSLMRQYGLLHVCLGLDLAWLIPVQACCEAKSGYHGA